MCLHASAARSYVSATPSKTLYPVLLSSQSSSHGWPVPGPGPGPGSSHGCLCPYWTPSLSLRWTSDPYTCCGSSSIMLNVLRADRKHMSWTVTSVGIHPTYRPQICTRCYDALFSAQLTTASGLLLQWSFYTFHHKKNKVSSYPVTCVCPPPPAFLRVARCHHCSLLIQSDTSISVNDPQAELSPLDVSKRGRWMLLAPPALL